MGSMDTWESRDSYWPDMIAHDSTTKTFDIYRVDYHTGILRGVRVSRIIESLFRAMDLAEAMGKYKTIHFIAHSLGGIVVRNYLLALKSFRGHWALNQFRQIILIGSPGGGSYLAAIASIIDNNPQLRILLPINRNDYLELLNDSWDGIVSKRRGICPTILLTVAYEQSPIPGLGIVVTEESATGYLSHEYGTWRAKGFERNHFNIVKSRYPDDPVYKWVNQAITECALGDASGPCPIPKDLPPFCLKPSLSHRRN